MATNAKPDWTREALMPGEWQPVRRLLRSIRDYQRLADARFCRRPRQAWAVLRHRIWSAVTGTDIPLNAPLAGGLLMPHPQGIVLHPQARVGPNCLLMQQVTLGMGGPIPGAPTLAAGVDVGAGAKVLGGVQVGAGAKIGANAVVLTDVPAGYTAVGIPARLLAPKGERSATRK